MSSSFNERSFPMQSVLSSSKHSDESEHEVDDDDEDDRQEQSTISITHKVTPIIIFTHNMQIILLYSLFYHSLHKEMIIKSPCWLLITESSRKSRKMEGPLMKRVSTLTTMLRLVLTVTLYSWSRLSYIPFPSSDVQDILQNDSVEGLLAKDSELIHEIRVRNNSLFCSKYEFHAFCLYLCVCIYVSLHQDLSIYIYVCIYVYTRICISVRM